VGVWTANAVVGLIIALLGVSLARHEVRDAEATEQYIEQRGNFETLRQVAVEHVARAKTSRALLKWHVVKQAINGAIGVLSLITIAIDGEAVHLLIALAVPVGLIVVSIGTTVSSVLIVRQLRRDHALRRKVLPIREPKALDSTPQGGDGADHTYGERESPVDDRDPRPPPAV